ncbi:MAG: Site-specific tyrosine recombinase XerC, partial [uncultured Acidimicrobiales bacterium]
AGWSAAGRSARAGGLAARRIRLLPHRPGRGHRPGLPHRRRQLRGLGRSGGGRGARGRRPAPAPAPPGLDGHPRPGSGHHGPSSCRAAALLPLAQPHGGGGGRPGPAAGGPSGCQTTATGAQPAGRVPAPRRRAIRRWWRRGPRSGRPAGRRRPRAAVRQRPAGGRALPAGRRRRRPATPARHRLGQGRQAAHRSHQRSRRRRRLCLAGLPPAAGRARGRSCARLQPGGPPPGRARCPPPTGPAVLLAHPPSRPPPHLCHPPARRRSRPAGGAGAARPRERRQHPGLHSRVQGAAPARARAHPSPRV